MSHSDQYAVLNSNESLIFKLTQLHRLIKQHHQFIARVAIALYDADTDVVRTFVFSGEKSPLNHYQARLADCYSLKKLAYDQQPRLENDLAVFSDSEHIHAIKIYQAGYRASYTLPMLWNNKLIGFVFFNAKAADVFTDACMQELDVIGHLLTLVLVNEMSSVRTLMATLRSALDLTHSRDPETGFHLERMSRYARMIARVTADHFSTDDHFVEHVFLFAPLHDLGKLAIPDNVLLKPGKLTDVEYQVMKTHSKAGLELVDKLLVNYGLNGVSYIPMLRNIVLHHHEAWDGSGYPLGLSGQNIPLEARIVAVADVFDALTSERPYKTAWSNEDAYAKLKELAGIKLDPVCVEALLAQDSEICVIQNSFKERKFG